MSIAGMLRGISGELEIGRATLAGAALAATVSPIGFQAWEMANGGHFDAVAWCTAYPGGLAALVTAGILGIGSKDKKVADARATGAPA